MIGFFLDEWLKDRAEAKGKKVRRSLKDPKHPKNRKKDVT